MKKDPICPVCDGVTDLFLARPSRCARCGLAARQYEALAGNPELLAHARGLWTEIEVWRHDAVTKTARRILPGAMAELRAQTGGNCTPEGAATLALAYARALVAELSRAARPAGGADGDK